VVFELSLNVEEPMKSWIARRILALFGWSVVGKTPDIPKYVLIAAPHTSSWDVPVYLLVAWALKLKATWMMKAEMFRGLRGPFFKALGGMPIDRSQRHNTVQQCIDAFNQRSKLVLVIPPEGTREAAKVWKTGFYYIALGAKVPIVFGFLDFGKRQGGIGSMFMPTGDIAADMEQIREFYKDKVGKHPEKFGEVSI
jgi:1-acyl-sn-glycerol-3-phosphate acyltransferase